MAVGLQTAGALTQDVKAAATKLGKGQVENPNGVLGKDEFLKLLLVELQHQDPTAPVETDKILSQTSQLASLEASTNTNLELGKLSGSLRSSMKFTTVSAMGKIADMGSDEIRLKENGNANFEIYVPEQIASGTIEVNDNVGNLVKSINVSETNKGTRSFFWNGENNDGNRAEEGSYHVRLKYNAKNGGFGETGVGVYPVSSIKFEDGKTLLKLGTRYVPFNAVKEIYEGNK
ncbi:MAG: flagellar hook capping protein [Thiovulaceae bacterium]|nr:flagellar hook capping protein [Sulfurimonadaceae bacterium]